MELLEHDGELHFGETALGSLAERLGTPLVIYDAHALADSLEQFSRAFSTLRAVICFAADAAPNIHVLQRLVKNGAGLRVRTAADLERAWLSGATLSRVVYSGLGKTDNDIRAALDGLYSPLFQAGRLVEGKPPYYRGPVGFFSVETAHELEQVARLAGGVRIACRALIRVALPQCASSVVGASPDATAALFQRFGSDPRIRLCGLRMHLGRFGVSVDTFADATAALCRLAQQLTDAGADITTLDLGGGFACNAWDPAAPSPADYAAAIEPLLIPFAQRNVRIIIEPGWPIASAGSVLLSRVLTERSVADEPIALVDAMPADPASMSPRHVFPAAATSTPGRICDVNLPAHCVRTDRSFKTGDLLAWCGGGAYARRATDLASEALLEQGRTFVVRPGPAVSDLIRSELDPREVML